MKYTIQEGDTLRGLAASKLGDWQKWTLLWTMNRAVLRSGNPDLIYPGEVIDIPDQPKPAPETATAPLQGSENPNEAILYVGGRQFKGWKDVEITRSMDAASAGFSLRLVEKWGPTGEVWPIFPGEACVLKIGRDTMVTGYIDEMALSIGAEDHTIQASGRDKTADIIDCSVMNRPGEWKQKSVERIVQELCEPFGVQVKAEVATGGVVDVFQAQPGEKVFEAIERLAKLRGLLVSSAPDGTLLLTRSSDITTGITLREGANVLSASAQFTWKDRFSVYHVECQKQGGGQSGAAVRGTANDPSVTRYRPLILTAELSTDPAGANKRASWEAAIRAGKSQTATVTVQGWRDGYGNIWVPNRTVSVDLPSLRLDGTMLISECRYKKGEDGTGTTLTLKRPDSYNPSGNSMPQSSEPVRR